VPGVSPLAAPILFAFQQAREDLATHTEGLTREQIWADPFGLGSLGFQLRHIAGSTERLIAYLEGKQLSENQMAALETEKQPGGSREKLLADLDSVFRKSEVVVRALNPMALAETREVGRKRLPTTVIGLLTHIAEHTQRHVGQAICAAKVARSLR
jgi:uncharacterized damage-inducible protein DinB